MIIAVGLATFSLQILSSTVLLTRILLVIKNANLSINSLGLLPTSILLIPGTSILFLEYLLLSILKIFNWQTISIVVLLNFAAGFQIISKKIRSVYFSMTKCRYHVFNFLILFPFALVQSLLMLMPDTNRDVAVFHQPLIDPIVTSTTLAPNCKAISLLESNDPLSATITSPKTLQSDRDLKLFCRT